MSSRGASFSLLRLNELPLCTSRRPFATYLPHRLPLELPSSNRRVQPLPLFYQSASRRMGPRTHYGYMRDEFTAEDIMEESTPPPSPQPGTELTEEWMDVDVGDREVGSLSPTFDFEEIAYNSCVDATRVPTVLPNPARNDISDAADTLPVGVHAVLQVRVVPAAAGPSL